MRFEAEQGDFHEAGDVVDGWIIRFEEDEGDFGPSIKWIVWDMEGDKEEWFWSGQKLTPRSNLMKYARALTGVESPETFDTDAYLGEPVRLVFGENSNGRVAVQTLKRREGSRAPAAVLSMSDESPF